MNPRQFAPSVRVGSALCNRFEDLGVGLNVLIVAQKFEIVARDGNVLGMLGEILPQQSTRFSCVAHRFVDSGKLYYDVAWVCALAEGCFIVPARNLVIAFACSHGGEFDCPRRQSGNDCDAGEETRDDNCDHADRHQAPPALTRTMRMAAPRSAPRGTEKDRRPSSFATASVVWDRPGYVTSICQICPGAVRQRISPGPKPSAVNDT
ncbi:MAG: hypothetical protein IID54_05605, partial [Proteobacteria bacterium]|nr:hypothetical protein [Pseudomonadota bacterium]